MGMNRAEKALQKNGMVCYDLLSYASDISNIHIHISIS